MSGEQKLEPGEFVEKKVLEVIERVNNEWGKIGMSMVGKPRDIEEVLSIEQDDLKKLTREDCAHKSFALSQYALFLQKEENQVKAITEFLTNALDIVVGKEAKNYGDKFTKYEYAKSMVIAHNSYANKLNKELSKYTQNLNSLSFLANRVQRLSDKLNDILNARGRI